MATIQMTPSTAREVVHLFEIMKKYSSACSAEYNIENADRPSIGITSAPVSVEYFEGDPNAVLVKLGETDFSFEVGKCSFSKDISNYQILICITGDYFAAWFNSGFIPSEGIREAKSFQDDICITDLPDGGCIVEMDGEVERYTKEEIAEMERGYKDAILRRLKGVAAT